jgi:hypothetical protein
MFSHSPTHITGESILNVSGNIMHVNCAHCVRCGITFDAKSTQPFLLRAKKSSNRADGEETDDSNGNSSSYSDSESLGDSGSLQSSCQLLCMKCKEKRRARRQQRQLAVGASATSASGLSPHLQKRFLHDGSEVSFELRRRRISICHPFIRTLVCYLHHHAKSAKSAKSITNELIPLFLFNTGGSNCSCSHLLAVLWRLRG